MRGPIIHVSRQLEKDNASDRYTDNVLHIANYGKPIKELKADVISLISLEVGDIQRVLPVIYFIGQFPTGNFEGKIKAFRQTKNDLAYFHLGKGLRILRMAKNLPNIKNLELRIFVELSYKDLLNSVHSKCFVVPSGEGREVGPEACAQERKRLADLDIGCRKKVSVMTYCHFEIHNQPPS